MSNCLIILMTSNPESHLLKQIIYNLEHIVGRLCGSEVS
jgi:hypothetical protein